MNMDHIHACNLSRLQPDSYEHLLAEGKYAIFSSIMRILNNCKLKTCAMITTSFASTASGSLAELAGEGGRRYI